MGRISQHRPQHKQSDRGSQEKNKVAINQGKT
jgi:hypothetical protein